MTARQIDINVDAGESYGPWPMGSDDQLYPLVSSANLACGFHAGDPVTMQRSVALAKEHGVAVGAHPGYPDLVGFGRRHMAVKPGDLTAYVIYQIGALRAFVQAAGLTLHHVKAHGALYLDMAREEAAARAVAEAVRQAAPEVPMVVLPGTVMEDAARSLGLTTVREAFPDRGYLASGQLAPRHLGGALVLDPKRAAERAVAMASGGAIETLDGGSIHVAAETLCIHGDNEEAPDIARAVKGALEAEGITVCPY